MPVGLRHLGRSAIQPPASFAKLDRPSETPSITPSAKAGAPKLARNAGRIEVAASCPQSENKLAKPMPKTPRVSQRFGEDHTLALERSLMRKDYPAALLRNGVEVEPSIKGIAARTIL